MKKKTPEQKAALKAEFWFNIRSMPKFLSFWVTTIASLVAAYWLGLDKEAQTELVKDYPILVKSMPFITMVAWIYARAKPQGQPSPEFQATQPQSEPENGT